MRVKTWIGSAAVCLGLVGCRPTPAEPSKTEQPTDPTASVDTTAAQADAPADAYWKQPPQEVLDVLHAPSLPWVFTAPTGQTMLLADPLSYPALADFGATKHRLAGMKVDPRTNGYHGRTGALQPRLVSVDSGETTPLSLPEGLEVTDDDIFVVVEPEGETGLSEEELANNYILYVSVNETP